MKASSSSCFEITVVLFNARHLVSVWLKAIVFQHGASIEIRDKLQRTALIHAAMNGHYPVITFLLNKGNLYSVVNRFM